MSYGFFFFISLLLTLVVEIPALFILAKYLLKVKVPAREILCWGFFVNLFSFPYLWFVFPLFISSHNFIMIGETLVVLMESIILLKVLKINFKNAIILSLIVNVASYLIGLIVFR
jgi:hypothetical protein